jgi:hypothetical protein
MVFSACSEVVIIFGHLEHLRPECNESPGIGGEVDAG